MWRNHTKLTRLPPALLHLTTHATSQTLILAPHQRLAKPRTRDKKR